MNVRLLRAKVTAHTGTPGGSESEYTFTLSYEDQGGLVSISGVKPEWLPFWGDTVKVDPSKLVGRIVPAQLSTPKNLVEAFFYIPPMIADCETPQSAMTMEERTTAMVRMQTQVGQGSFTTENTSGGGGES